MNARDREDELTLGILENIEGRQDISQRDLARRLGIALGLTNAYLKRCARKGFLKIQQAPANRYLYYLTPKGFAEKSRLTARYFSHSIVFFRRAGHDCRALLLGSKQDGRDRVLLFGVSELAEIAYLRAKELDMEVVGVVDESSRLETFFGRPLFRQIPAVDAYDVCLLTDLTRPHLAYERLVSEIGFEKVLVPRILGIGLEVRAVDG